MSRLVLILSLVVVCAATLCACGGSSGSSGTTGGGEKPAGAISAPLQHAVAEAGASGVPVRIPQRLLKTPPEGAEEAEVLRSPPDSYTLGLMKSPGCHLRSTCTAAIFSGFAGGGALTGSKVKLVEGITGVYEPGRCGPGCSFGTVEWIQAGDRYGVGIAGESRVEVLIAANEAIAAPPLTAGH